MRRAARLAAAAADYSDVREADARAAATSVLADAALFAVDVPAAVAGRKRRRGDDAGLPAPSLSTTAPETDLVSPPAARKAKLYVPDPPPERRTSKAERALLAREEQRAAAGAPTRRRLPSITQNALMAGKVLKPPAPSTATGQPPVVHLSDIWATADEPAAGGSEVAVGDLPALAGVSASAPARKRRRLSSVAAAASAAAASALTNAALASGYSYHPTAEHHEAMVAALRERNERTRRRQRHVSAQLRPSTAFEAAWAAAAAGEPRAGKGRGGDDDVMDDDSDRSDHEGGPAAAAAVTATEEGGDAGTRDRAARTGIPSRLPESGMVTTALGPVQVETLSRRQRRRLETKGRVYRADEEARRKAEATAAAKVASFLKPMTAAEFDAALAEGGAGAGVAGGRGRKAAPAAAAVVPSTLLVSEAARMGAGGRGTGAPRNLGRSGLIREHVRAVEDLSGNLRGAKVAATGELMAEHLSKMVATGLVAPQTHRRAARSSKRHRVRLVEFPRTYEGAGSLASPAIIAAAEAAEEAAAAAAKAQRAQRSDGRR